MMGRWRETTGLIIMRDLPLSMQKDITSYRSLV